MAPLDLAEVRRHFPGLDDDWAFFDNAGGSFPVAAVAERAAEHLRRFPVQLGGTYDRSAEARARVEAGRAAAAKLVGAKPQEIVLGSSTTLNSLLLSQALADNFTVGDEIVVTNLDHEANIGAWRRLADRGLVVREWPFDPDTLALRFEHLEPLLNDRTRLVCFTHCSNLVGAFHDVRELTQQIHDAGAWVCVDGVAFAPHRRVDVKELSVDFYLLSLYKVYGPHLGLLYVDPKRREQINNQNHFFLEEEAGMVRLQPGGVNYELASSLPAVIEYLEGLAPEGTPSEERLSLAFQRIAEHEERLVRPLLEWLSAHPKTSVIGPETADRSIRAPTVSFRVDQQRSDAVATALERFGVAVRHGHFYARRAVRDLGFDPDGVVRASMAHYNSPEEVARLLRSLDTVL